MCVSGLIVFVLRLFVMMISLGWKCVSVGSMICLNVYWYVLLLLLVSSGMFRFVLMFVFLL